MEERVSNFKPNTSKKEQSKVDMYILEMMCKMIATDSRLIRRTQLINLEKYINSINPKSYINDAGRSKMINFLRRGLEARLQYNLTTPSSIIAHINGGILDDGVIDTNDFVGLNSSEIQWLNDMISETLKYTVMTEKVGNLLDSCTKFVTKDFTSKAGILKTLEGQINDIQNDFRRVRNESHTDAMFNLEDGAFEDCIHDTYNQLSNPGRKLMTGMQGMNELLGGGFESGRTYVFFGLPGEGKSTLLLNILYQIKKYNKDYVCKDPTKTPCVVLLTMENVMVESTQRFFSMVTNKRNMIDYKVDDVITMMRFDGELYLNEASPINIVIAYQPSNSVDTSYLYTLTDNLEDMGYEVIAFIQDYIGRIRSTENHGGEIRLEFGSIVDEFKSFAANKDIPVITASQLNRDASKHIDEGRKNNSSDLVRFLGRSNIAESINILNNTDGGFVIAPEITADGTKYLGVQRIKKRYDASDMDYAYIPFVDKGIGLEEDVGRPPTFKTTLRMDSFGCPYESRSSQYKTNAVRDINTVVPQANDDTDASIFGNATMIVGGGPTLDALSLKQRDIRYCPIIREKPHNPIITFKK